MLLCFYEMFEFGYELDRDKTNDTLEVSFFIPRKLFTLVDNSVGNCCSRRKLWEHKT